MKRKLVRSLSLSLIFLVVSTANIFPSSLHRFHASLTRMDYNSKKQVLEITIQLFIHDLVPVLEKHNKVGIDLEKTAGIDKIILDYLNKNFVLKTKSGETKQLEWVGKELEVDSAYIHAVIPLPEGLEGSSLQNTIFFETFKEQTNRVNVHNDRQSAALIYITGDNSKEISFQQSKEN